RRVGGEVPAKFDHQFRRFLETRDMAIANHGAQDVDRHLLALADLAFDRWNRASGRFHSPSGIGGEGHEPSVVLGHYRQERGGFRPLVVGADTIDEQVPLATVPTNRDLRSRDYLDAPALSKVDRLQHRV